MDYILTTINREDAEWKTGDSCGKIRGGICEFILGKGINGQSSPFRCYSLLYLKCGKLV